MTEIAIKIEKIKQDNSLTVLDKGRLIYKLLKREYPEVEFDPELAIELLEEFEMQLKCPFCQNDKLEIKSVLNAYYEIECSCGLSMKKPTEKELIINWDKIIKLADENDRI